MCTAIGTRMGDFYFGRSMDIECGFGGELTLAPRNFPIKLHFIDTLNTHHAILGMAANVNGYPLYADAFNEKGLCMAGLLFPQSAYYPDTPIDGKTPLCPFELMPYILGVCSDIYEARELLESVTLVNKPFSSTVPLSPLHWIISDRYGSLTVEPTQSGLEIYKNDFGVLSNEPPFPYHTENIKRYIGLSPAYRGSGALGDLSPFGGGLCATGLDGDYSSPSRFTRAAYLARVCMPTPNAAEEAKAAHLLALIGSVAPPHGAVLDAEGRPHYTLYSCCINADKGIYYLKKYGELTTHTVKISEYNLYSDTPIITCT